MENLNRRNAGDLIYKFADRRLISAINPGARSLEVGMASLSGVLSICAYNGAQRQGLSNSESSQLDFIGKI